MFGIKDIMAAGKHFACFHVNAYTEAAFAPVVDLGAAGAQLDNRPPELDFPGVIKGIDAHRVH